MAAREAPTRSIRVLVADPAPLYRDAVVRLVRQRADLQLVGEAADGRDALAAIRRVHPDVAVLDAELPELDAVRAANAVARDGLPTRIVVLTSGTRSDVVYAALAAGVDGCLSKRASAEQLEDAIRRVSRGLGVLAPELQAGVTREIRLRARTEASLVSPREREVLTMVAAGLSAPEIGRRLHLATPTVKSHLAHVYGKLGVEERAAAVAEGMRRGLLE